MPARRQTPLRRTAIVTLCTLLLSPGGLMGGTAFTVLTAASRQATTAAKPATAAAAKPVPAPAAPVVDGVWPRRVHDGERRGVHPLPAADRELGGPEAHDLLCGSVVYRQAGRQDPRSARSRRKRTPRCRSPSGSSSSRSCGSPSRTSRRSTNRRCRRSLPRSPRASRRSDRVIALDRVLASIDKSQILPKNVEGVKADPPTVFFSKTPAVIVNIDGDPIWSPIAGTDLKYAINTNWDLFELGTTKTFYLRHDATWLKATSLPAPGRRPAPCPTASRRSRPTTTGRTSRPLFRARSWRRARRRRCSSAPRPPS